MERKDANAEGRKASTASAASQRPDRTQADGDLTLFLGNVSLSFHIASRVVRHLLPDALTWVICGSFKLSLRTTRALRLPRSGPQATRRKPSDTFAWILLRLLR